MPTYTHARARTHTLIYTHTHRTPAESIVGCTPGHRHKHTQKHTTKQVQLHPSPNKMLSCGSQTGVKRAAKKVPPFLS